jgi:hypothetical protein
MGWSDEDEATFCNVGERDIDFLLLEELRCSAEFRERFLREALKRLGVETIPPEGAVFHSVHRTGLSTGETDLQVEFRAISPSGSGTHAILIEDKIDAEFSDRTKCGSKQTERYRAEIATKTKAGTWIAAVVMLVAPQAYLDKVECKAFDATVSYEAICGWFEEQIARDSTSRAFRLEHKRQMLKAAILRLRRGWQRQADKTVGSIWRLYHQIASADYSDVRMNYKGDEPPDSYTVSFACLPRVDGLPKCRIDHVMERGTVDILISGYAERLPMLSHSLAGLLGKGISLRRAGKSLGVNIKVASIQRFADPASQAASIREALEAVRRLKIWFERNAPAIAKL